jgi:hypothetical protein
MSSGESAPTAPKCGRRKLRPPPIEDEGPEPAAAEPPQKRARLDLAASPLVLPPCSKSAILAQWMKDAGGPAATPPPTAAEPAVVLGVAPLPKPRPKAAAGPPSQPRLLSKPRPPSKPPPFAPPPRMPRPPSVPPPHLAVPRPVPLTSPPLLSKLPPLRNPRQEPLEPQPLPPGLITSPRRQSADLPPWRRKPRPPSEPPCVMRPPQWAAILGAQNVLLLPRRPQP